MRGPKSRLGKNSLFTPKSPAKNLRLVPEGTRKNRLAYDKCTSGGRFLSIDPVVTDANTGSSFNRYAYAKNNPYIYVDPDGRRDIYIGGAADKNNTRIVQDYAGAQKKANPGRDIQYFSYSEKKEITAAVNAPLQTGEPLNVIGHSLGGREAINQANNTGAQITNLVPIDPVGSAGNGTKSSNVGTWTDVTAVPANRIPQIQLPALVGRSSARQRHRGPTPRKKLQLATVILTE